MLRSTRTSTATLVQTSTRVRVIVFINNRFFKLRYKHENPTEPEISKIAGSHAKLPKQENNCDCGVFILQYIEELIRDFPTETPVNRKTCFGTEEISKKRQDIRSKICALHAEQSGSSQPID